MPIYAYRCDACGRESEMLQKLSASAPACPHCASMQMVKQVTAAGFQLKGSGYYATDFKSPAPTQPASSDAAISAAAPSSQAASPISSATTPPASCGAGCACH